MNLKRLPVATISVLAVTGIVTGLQFVYAPLLPSLERAPTALAQHEWWRLITPLFVHADGWRQIAFNFPAILIVGILAERVWGKWRWLGIYFLCGIVGEMAGYAWKPHGAGASVAGAGLLGSLAAWLLWKRGAAPARIGGAVILLGAAVLTLFRDLHGPPILAGALLGFAMVKFDSKKAQHAAAHDLP